MHAHVKSSNPVTTIGLDIGKNAFHLIGLDKVTNTNQGSHRLPHNIRSLRFTKGMDALPPATLARQS